MRLADLSEGGGVTGEIGGRPVAVYQAGGQVTVLENICTHMQCRLEWNQADGVWDCPCHGSRFAAEGSLVRGPARSPLKALVYVVEDGEIKLADDEES